MAYYIVIIQLKMIIKRIDNTGCLVAIYEIENIFHVTSSFNSPKSVRMSKISEAE